MLTTDRLAARLRARLDALEAAGLRRTLRPPEGIDLSSNDYLQLARDPRLAARLADAAQAEGCGSSGSRLLRGERRAVSALERRFARFKGAERALYFATGYQANVAVLSTLVEPGDVVLSDERNHASLIDGMRLAGARRVIVPHADPAALARHLAHIGPGGHAFVVTESLFSMDGDEAPLAQYAALCRTHGATLIVDEAHAVGVFGARGSGLLEEAGLDQPGEDDTMTLVSVNTAGKALGVAGAFVAGPEPVIEYLLQRARPFVFSTAPPPPLAAALEAALDIVAAEPDRRHRLAALAARLRARLSALPVTVPPGRSQIVPVILGDNARALRVASALQARGFDVRAIRPPSVAPGTARLRISLNAGLSENIVDRLAAALADQPELRA